MQVRVVNDNVHPYKENFRDRLIVIPPGGSVEMDQDEADYFLQTYCAPVKDAQGRPDPLHFKKLRIHPEDMKAVRDHAVNSLVCHANGQKAQNDTELKEILSNFAHMVADRDDGGENELKKRNSSLKKENKDLKERLDRIEAKLGVIHSSHEEETNSDEKNL